MNFHEITYFCYLSRQLTNLYKTIEFINNNEYIFINIFYLFYLNILINNSFVQVITQYFN